MASCYDSLPTIFPWQVVTAIRNMARQHRELYYRLEDAEKLWFYAQSATSKHRALEESLDKAKFWSKHWERKAKEGTERIMNAEKEMDRAKEEA